MPTTKPTKPSITLPSAFGTSVSNVKTPFTAQELIDGYSASVQQVLDGGNVNWLNDATFKFLTYTTAICDWLNQLSVGNIPYINSSNQLDSLDLNTVISKWGLFDYKWSDHEINDQSWLKADTFSWQPGATYTNAYNTLVTESTGVTPTTETVGSYTITVYEASNGRKIVMADQETTVQNIYNESGVAWYYILDTTNQRFKLPRENPAREELTQVVRSKGNGLILGLTDGTNNYGIRGNGSTVYLQAYTNGYGANAGDTVADAGGQQSTTKIGLGITPDSTKSGIISSMTDSTSVYKGKKYLYFYVGQFSQSATEQTAGLNASLFNGKMDIDMNNATPEAIARVASWGMPDYTAGVSVAYTDLNSGYTAPYNGVLLCNFGLNGTITINSLSFATQLNYTNRQLREIHLNKGDVITTTTLNSTYGGDNMFFPLKGVNNA